MNGGALVPVVSNVKKEPTQVVELICWKEMSAAEIGHAILLDPNVRVTVGLAEQG